MGVETFFSFILDKYSSISMGKRSDPIIIISIRPVSYINARGLRLSSLSVNVSFSYYLLVLSHQVVFGRPLEVHPGPPLN